MTPVCDLPVVNERRLRPSAEAARDFFDDDELRRSLYVRDGWQCAYCGDEVTAENATLDHVVPRSKGGSNAADNLVTACLTCNSIKSDRTYDDAAPQILDALRDRRG